MEDVVSSEEAAEFLNPLRFYRHVAIAVSGGGDSMALMWLAARWAGVTRQPPQLTILTVDHGLRPEATGEARWVVAEAAKLGLTALVLRWQGDKPFTGLQARAREARYDLLIGWCIDHEAGALVTAHSLDDQAETFMMRLARGSGVDGLAGMRPMREGKVAVLRPLLGMSGARLRHTLLAAGVNWLEDPSNRDERFERVRWRKTLAYLETQGLAAGMIALSARRLERARVALEHAALRLETQVVAHAETHASFGLAAIQGEPEEVVLRLLRCLIMRYGPHGEAPELSALERLNEWIQLGVSGGRTLAGCRITRRKDAVRISREPPRRQHRPRLPLR